MKIQRILLKLSGEALNNDDNFGIDPHILNEYSTIIATIINHNIQVGIVIGGGNFYRGNKSNQLGIKNITGDKMGMLATLMNALALRDSLQTKHINSHILTSFIIPQFVDAFTPEKAKSILSKNEICIFAGGTGNPLFTTDSAAALRAIEIEADCLIKGTNVDGVYDTDPRNNPNAKMFSTITFNECITLNLKVMDQTAFVICKENNMPIIVTNIRDKTNIQKIINGKISGTLITT